MTVEHSQAWEAGRTRNIISNAKKTFYATYSDAAEIEAYLQTGMVWDERDQSWDYKVNFAGSLAKGFDTYGKLSLKQVEAVRKHILAYAQRKAEWADEAAELNAKRQHLGNVGEKVTLTLTVKHIHTMDGAYGPTYLHICEDEDKNLVIYKGASNAFPYKGETATVIASVKEHGVRNGVKQTVIQRPKVQGDFVHQGE